MAGQSTATPTPGTPPEPSEFALELADTLAPTRPMQYLVSLVALAGFLLGTYLVYRSGPLLKRRLTDDGAEGLQVAVATLLSICSAGVLVVVWRRTPAVRLALDSVSPSPVAGVRLFIVLVALSITYTATRVAKRFIRVGESRNAITSHQREVLHHLVQIVLFIPAVLFSLTLYGIPAQNLLLSASALGVVLGLAARQTLGAVLAGFVLLFSRPFEVGDWVEIDDNEGVVTDISIVNTRLQTFDDEMVMIPNDQITDSAITNRSRNERLRVQTDVGVDYDTDVPEACRIATEAMDDIEMLMDGPEPEVVVKEFGDSAVTLNLRFWISDPTIQKKWAAQNAVMEAVKQAFEEHDIAIPFPQRVLSGREHTGGLDVRSVDADSSDAGDTPDEASDHNG
ncbi:mechanosensitive ion channel family protein [Halosegnis longus]|uniref:Mechanosensitive ion channel family protein n=1 Tax=Halosegnis longus TaxID=2216012 RepID=A0AAJ4R8M2_9EURY|nr:MULTISPECIES: mechanosensitive ion channel family protein [Halobacteriales]RNJ26207.1 mechanosensitive ion channel family protein [Salella cibi]